MVPLSHPVCRRAVRLTGVVQGVGLRPAVIRLARMLGLGGFVENRKVAVQVEVEGPLEDVEAFVAHLPRALPPLARVDTMESRDVPLRGDTEFRFVVTEGEEPSGTPSAPDPIPPDLAPCDDCLREMDDPAGRRFRYPFISCVSCGPRYTIARETPYDRPRTSMGSFPLCDACRQENDDPADRRFLSQADSCPACGPALELIVREGIEPPGESARAILPDAPRTGAAPCAGPMALMKAAELLHAGRILAVKGTGGFVLACDATNDAAVALLRERKHRPHKPFAVMGRSVEEIEAIVTLTDLERDTLLSPARPIVLARRRRDARLSAGVAPCLDEIGVFLPPTPLQRLLLRDGPPLQVMTSGNLSGEPIAKDEGEADDRLARIADAILQHGRRIEARADDSVVRELGGGLTLLRRARGHVPEGIPLPFDTPPILAVGAGEKNTVCLATGRFAFLSPHVGDLDHPDTRAAFEEAIRHLLRLHAGRPIAVAHDLHPDFASTRWARQSGLALVPVQHHHAHVASCLAEHGRTAPVIGVAFDGTGLGEDGSIWGGEFLVADLRSSRRLGHLRALPLAGGEAAIREPWRLALAALRDAGCGIPPGLGPDETRVRAVERLVDGAPRATSAGRWFDAVAALCGLRSEITYEGQAAMELEAAARGTPAGAPLGFGIDDEGTGFEIDLRASIREMAALLEPFGETTPARVDALRTIASRSHLTSPGPVGAVRSIAARFHATMAEAIREGCRRARDQGAPSTVALAGGCFQNRLLVAEAKERLESDGFEVLVNRRVPPNDGGIALGQAAIAAARLLSPATGS